MNEFFSSSADPPPAPIPSSDDRCVLPSNRTPDTFAAALGQSLLLGFVGQIGFTILQLGIASGTHGHAEAADSVGKQMLLLGLPIVCAIGGALDGQAHPSRKVAHPLSVTILCLLIGVLGLFNLFVMFLTGMAGYC